MIHINGTEAVARGAWEAGVRVSTSYPGSPMVEVTDAMNQYKEVWTEWSINEKVAMEVAIGASLAGARSIVSMKHVGLNVAADPYMTLVETKLNGGLVIAVGEDPGMSSSQNEQDTRVYGKFGDIPILECADPQQALDFTKHAFELSEKINAPVLLRVMTNVCHTTAPVNEGPRKDIPAQNFTAPVENWVMVPPYSKARRRAIVADRVTSIIREAAPFAFNKHLAGAGDTLIVTAGHLAGYIKKWAPALPVFRLGMVWPLDRTELEPLFSGYKKILVVEELTPFIESELKLMGFSNVEGKKYFPLDGEITPEVLFAGLSKAGLAPEVSVPETAELPVPRRTPMFCAGCPHRPVIRALQMANVFAIGDIGCYLMGSYPPFDLVRSLICMGASVGMYQGALRSGNAPDGNKPMVAIIGDSTFLHSGITPLLNAVTTGTAVHLIILQNGTAAMTGGQDNAATHVGKTPSVDIAALVRSLGIPRVEVVDQFKFKELRATVADLLKDAGSWVMIATRPCAIRFKTRETPFTVKPDVCIACRSCIKVNCPPIKMKEYKDQPKLKSSIDPSMCVGCSVCSQVCPVGAIVRKEEK